MVEFTTETILHLFFWEIPKLWIQSIYLFVGLFRLSFFPWLCFSRFQFPSSLSIQVCCLFCWYILVHYDPSYFHKFNCNVSSLIPEFSNLSLLSYFLNQSTPNLVNIFKDPTFDFIDIFLCLSPICFLSNNYYFHSLACFVFSLLFFKSLVS